MSDDNAADKTLAQVDEAARRAILEEIPIAVATVKASYRWDKGLGHLKTIAEVYALVNGWTPAPDDGAAG